MTTRQRPTIRLADIRRAVADYMRSEGVRAVVTARPIVRTPRRWASYSGCRAMQTVLAGTSPSSEVGRRDDD